MLKTVVEKSLCVRTGLAFAALAAGLSVAALFSTVVTDAQARERDRTLKIMFTHTGETAVLPRPGSGTWAGWQHC